MKKFLVLTAILSCFIGQAQNNPEEPIANEYNIQEVTVVKLRKGDKITLDNLLFIGGSSGLREESKPLLEQLLEVMQNNPKLKIEIQGHVCCYPDRKNVLSKRRAKMVYDYLRSKGIAKKRISYKDFGGSKPIYPMPERNEEERIANRRVEIEVLSN
jgi:outer membrane protein OmpA-like peptidoglycan-associated protein